MTARNDVRDAIARVICESVDDEPMWSAVVIADRILKTLAKGAYHRAHGADNRLADRNRWGSLVLHIAATLGLDPSEVPT